MTPYLADQDLTVYVGDALEVLRRLPDESVDCCVTSPPYWGLRDYGTGEWEGGDEGCDHSPEQRGGRFASPVSAKQASNTGSGTASQRDCPCGARRVDRQIGLEPTPDLFVAAMVAVFREVRRVLAPHGTCWVNLGSSYFQGESYPLREIDAAWLAAIVDGEGSIQIHRQRRPASVNSVDSFQVDLGVGMMTPEVVQRCHEITGLGSCKQQNRGVWDWSCRGQQAAQLLRAIYPYLLTKKRQAALAIMLADDLAARRYGRGNPAQPEVMEWRQQARQAMSDLNQRRGTDFPIVEPKPIVLNLKPKDDTMVPSRVARALQEDGWYMRAEIVWAKPNPMPESVTDRPTKSHEMVYLLTKQPRYWFDQEAVREPAEWARWGDQTNRKHEGSGSAAGWIGDKPKGDLTQRRTAHYNTAERYGAGNGGNSGFDGLAAKMRAGEHAGRNVRSVWEIATQPYPEAHFATFPEELPRRAIAAGCPLQVCRALVCEKCGVAHPAATVESLWDVETETEAHTGGTQAVSERDAVQAELRRLRDVLREQESARLLAEMQRDQSDLDAGHEAEGRSDQSPWLHPPLDARLPLGYDREGLRAGTPLRDGTTPGTEVGASREGASPERGQGGQPSVESVDRDALDAPWRGRVPGLRDALLRSLTCSSCGSSGFRVCGKPRERIVERSVFDQAAIATKRQQPGALRQDGDRNLGGQQFNKFKAENPDRFVGWSDCGHNNYQPGVVLDPFAGAGTTLLVARKLGRHSIGIELNPEYAELIAKRTRQLSLLAEGAA